MIEEINEDENVNLVKSSKQREAYETAGHRIESDDTEVVDFSTASPKKDDDEITLVETLISLNDEIAQKFYEEEQAQLLMDEEYAQQVQAQWVSDEMLAAKRAEEKINKPPTHAQQRTYMSNYIKNMGGYTLKQLKQYIFKEIKMLFDKNIKSIRKLVPMESEGEIAVSKAGEGSSKEGKSLKRPAEKELGKEQQKKQKAKEDLSQERLQ
nr:hypothetical protein [Tanacetum cinerariifolium]